MHIAICIPLSLDHYGLEILKIHILRDIKVDDCFDFMYALLKDIIFQTEILLVIFL